MKRLIHGVVFAALVATAASAEMWNFDANPVNTPPPRFSSSKVSR